MTSTKFVSNTTQLSSTLGSLRIVATAKPCFYLDLEGVELSRHGSISILTLYDLLVSTVYLIDIHTLGASAFTTPALTSVNVIDASNSGDVSSPPLTLKSFLESRDIPKVFFDVRNDSDALFAHYNIRLQGVQDIQLMELATRRAIGGREYLVGLARCIETEAIIPYTHLAQFQEAKTRGKNLFDSHRGGRYKVFNDRPLQSEIEEYCVQDVVWMPRLWDLYNFRFVSAFWRWIAEEDALLRVQETQSDRYMPNGEHKKWGWSGNQISKARQQWSRKEKLNI